MKKKISLRVPDESKGMRLDQFLAEKLSGHVDQPLSKAKVRKLIMAGAVYLNQKRVRIASKELFRQALVDVILDTDRLFNDRASQQESFELTAQHILYEDHDIIAVNKPAGIPTQATLDQARDHLYAAVQRYIAKRDSKPGAYVGLHHRLDFDTSGIVLFTKTKAANPGVSEIFSARKAQKTYVAIAWNLENRTLRKTWTIKNYLNRSSQSGKGRMRFTAVTSGGDYAETELQVLETLNQAVFIEARPKTGRTHQIRVHLSEEGLPVLGDPVYGLREKEPIKSQRLMLHAHRLEFPHPITQKPIVIESIIPDAFQKAIQGLRNPSV
jgi:23S rRNA pseudouridine1911/1915/1917 synthase